MKLFRKINNKDYEFNDHLDDHPIKEGNIYRLYFLNYHRIGYGKEDNDRNIGIVDWPFEPFMLPQNMERDDAFKVLSYLTDFIEKNLNLEECSYESVKCLNEALNIERFGFQKVEEANPSKIINLYTVTGRILLFKNSPHYPFYFEWYQENVTLEEVKQIYHKLGMEFNDLIVDKPITLSKKINASQN